MILINQVQKNLRLNRIGQDRSQKVRLENNSTKIQKLRKKPKEILHQGPNHLQESPNLLKKSHLSLDQSLNQKVL